MSCYLFCIMLTAETRTGNVPLLIAPRAQRSRVSAEIIQAKKVTFRNHKFDSSPRKKETDREYKSRGDMRTVEFY